MQCLRLSQKFRYEIWCDPIHTVILRFSQIESMLMCSCVSDWSIWTGEDAGDHVIVTVHDKDNASQYSDDFEDDSGDDVSLNLNDSENSRAKHRHDLI